MIPRNKWRWHGDAGHCVIGHMCRFHMHTEIGDYRISTIGDYYYKEERQPLGAGPDSFFETYVFETNGPCHCGLAGCTHRNVDDWGEVDGVRHATMQEAEASHMAMCLKYAKAQGGTAA